MRGVVVIADGKGFRKALKSHVIRLFPQRQIYVRAEGRVRFFTLSSWLQMSLATLVVGIAGWVIYASTIYFAYNSVLASYKSIINDKQAAVEKSEAAYRDLLARAMQLNLRSFSRDSRLKENKQYLLDILARNAVLERNLVELKVDLTRWKKSHEHLAAAREELVRDIREVENKLEKMVQHNSALKEEMASLQGNLDAASARNAKKTSEADALRKQLAQANEKGKQLADAKSLLTQRLNKLQKELDKVSVERNGVIKQRSALERRLENLKGSLSSLNEIQQKLIAKLTERTVNNNQEVEETLSLTGIDVDAMLDELRRVQDEDDRSSGKGGPFVAYVGDLEKFAPNFPPMREIGTMLASLQDHVERWEGLRQILQRLPLASPLDQYQITSPFGKRRDPISGKYAMHDGIDLSSIPKAAVLASGPGKVVFVGWNGNYGKMVKIDHGMGIITCYGHLQKISVRTGQEVEAHQKIGVMGSTGRSTGIHLHYEVLVNDKPYDPLKFMKAGKDVFKG